MRCNLDPARRALLASAAFASVLIGSTAAAQITCDEPLVTVLTAGQQDGFALPTEPASPSAELLAFMNPPPLAFDDPTPNRHFGHTFTGLPPNIIGATLTLGVRASSFSNNDAMALDFSPGPVFAWSGAPLRVLAGVAAWDSPAQATLTLDLKNLPPFNGATDIRPDLADGDLDVFIQDDTAVDYLSLEITYCPPPPPCATPPWGMLGWWPFDEQPAGATTADLAQRNDGTLLNGPTSVAGMVGAALQFDGFDDRVEVADPAPGHPIDVGTGDFTFDMWIKTTDSAGVRTILDKREDQSSVLGYSFFLFNGELGLQLADGNGASFCSSNPAGSACTNYGSGISVADGAWHFVAVTVERGDPQGIRWYLDGNVVGTPGNPTIRPGSLDNTAPLRIAGHSFNGGGDFTGILDEVEIFARALDESDLDAIYEAGSSGKCKPTIHEPWDISMCPDDRSIVIHPEICNNSSQTQSFGLAFAACPNGPLSFTLLGSQPVVVPPRSCSSVAVTVTRPPNLQLGDQRCFDITANNLTNGQVTTHHTAIYGSLPCARSGRTGPYGVSQGEPTSVDFVLRNPSPAPRTVSYEIEAMPAESGGVPILLDGGAPGEPVTGQVTVPAQGTAEVAVDVELDGYQPFAYGDVLLLDTADGAVLASAGVRSLIPGCTPSATSLCLRNGRFQVSVAWRDFSGNTGVGQAVPLTSDTGYFWFFNAANVELVLKVLDGRPVNGFFWVFYGALSTVEYSITVTDTETGTSKTYVNPSGNLASVADTAALPGGAGLTAGDEGATLAQEIAANPLSFAELMSGGEALAAGEDLLPLGSCAPSSTALCLNGNRFRVEVEWRTPQGLTGVGHAVPLTTDTGYFWFFNAANVELILKVLDGRPVNNHWWVFYGALSNVEYRITVTDTETGAVRTYFNPQGNLGSVADTGAF